MDAASEAVSEPALGQHGGFDVATDEYVAVGVQDLHVALGSKAKVRMSTSICLRVQQAFLQPLKSLSPYP